MLLKKTNSWQHIKWIAVAFGAFVLLLSAGATSCALAAEKFCSDYGGVLDGNVLVTPPVQITIDTDCTFQNWPPSNPLNTTINFQTNDPSIYLIIFDNVWYDGNMACANISHKLWVVNSEQGSFSSSCQDIMIPTETIAKQSPATTASIGVPFTYTLTMPSMNFPAGDPSANDLHTVILWDDLTATGADLTYVGINAYYKGSGAPVTLTPEDDPTAPGGVWTTKNLSYKPFPLILAGEQIVVEITVVLNDTPANSSGGLFTNTAKWWFGRAIDVNDDGTITNPDEFFEPLPGESGISQPMTIAEPNLVVTKSSTATALNIGDTATFTIDIQNNGGGDAWNTTILDNIPDGMCVYDPSPTVTAQIFAADGVTPVTAPLVQDTDYTITYSGASPCQLSMTMLDTAEAKIGPSQRLIIAYQSQLDPGFSLDGAALTNVAGATQWFSAASSYTGRRQYGPFSLTDGTPGVPDFQDSSTVTAALHGYYFEKTVANLNTGLNPTTTAAPGDTLHYNVRLFNVDQTINGITVSDELDVVNTFGGAPTNVTVSSGTYSFNPTGGTSGTGLMEITGVSVAPGGELVIDFDITLRSTLTNGTVVSNQASLVADQGTPDPGDDFLTTSDDPFINGVSSPDDPNDQDLTNVTIQIPDPLSKANPAQTSVMVGEQFTYRIEVPATPTAVALYDVRILDNLDLSAADMHFISANVVSGGGWSLSNTGSATNLIIEDTSTGIDIPAYGQAIIEITVELDNAIANQSGLPFTNSASYTYNRMNGNDATQTASGPGSTTAMTVVEPDLAVAKTMSYVTPAAKAAGDPAAAGDVLQYTLTISNNGDSTAFDTNIVDTLPVNVSLVSDSATAAINGTPVSGFVVNPWVLLNGDVAWGRQNSDGSLDIPAGQSLVLTYQVNVVSVNGLPFNNSVYVDWTSLQDAQGAERSGAGCPAITAPDDYCEGPASVTVNTIDTTAIVKSVVSDSWDSGGSTGDDEILRVGDTVVYRLALTLREGLLGNVVVADTLPAAVAFDGVVSVNGDATAPYSATGAFSYADIPAANVPTPGQTGTLTWTLGDITNAIDHDTSNDTFVIEYRGLVLKDTLAQAASTALTNNVALSYTGSDPAATNLQSNADIDVRQPVMTTPTKTAAGFTSPANVDIVIDVMPFHLESCNNGSAPAYSARFTDVLASQMDETSISGPVNGAGQPDVYVGGTLLSAATDYTYTPPAGRGGTMQFLLNTPVGPGQCVTIDYTIGFHTDVGPNQTWNNTVTLDEYWSLTAPTATGQAYGPLSSAPFIMSNPATIEPLAKSVLAPAGGEVTIGEEAVYQITVPGVPVNAALSNVVVTDTLNSALEYVSATAVDNGGNPVPLTDNSVAPDNVNLTIAQIPAGGQVIITLNTRVDNNTSANAGLSFTNTAAYTYTGIPAGSVTDGTSGPLTIVEPLVSVAKSVPPATAPTAGDILTYTVDLTATPGADYSGAFDTGLVDTLSLGLAYVPGTAQVAGVPSEPATAGDGITTAQTLTWIDIDIPEATTVTVTYDVRVLDSVGVGQKLTNNVTARWTSLDGASTFERNGSGTPAYNDYVATAATSLTTPDNTTLAKTHLSDTYNTADANLRVGDLVDYELRLGLQEGTHTGLVLTDTLPSGLTFVAVVSADFFGSPGTATPTVAGQTITWNLGTVVNAADGDPTNDYLVIVYRARVLNGGVLPQVNSIPLANNATLDHTIGGLPAPQLSAGQTVTVLQPNLTVSKSAAPDNGDTVIDAGEGITYTIDVINNGAAPAYDMVVQDILPVGLRQGGVTTTSITRLPAATALPVFNPVYDPATGTATWNFDSIAADTYTISADETLHIVYQVQADADLGPGLALINAATATLYYSFDDEAVPANGNVADRAVYGPSKTATYTLTTPIPGGPLKENPADVTAAIGQQFTYIITVPATPQPTALHDVRILDDLSAITADLTLVGVTKISGSQPWTPVNSGTATSLIIEDTATGIEIPANEQIVIGVTLRLDNSGTNNAGITFNNSASYTYNQVDGDTGSQLDGGSSATTNMTVIEPALTVAKSPTLVTPAPITGGSVLEYALTVENTGNADAYDVNLVDTLPPELALFGGFTPTATINGSTVAGFTALPAGAPAGPLVWGRNNGDGSLDIPVGGTLVLTYQAQVQISTAATFSNQVWVDWTSLNGLDTFERTGDGCPTETAPNDYCAGPATTENSITDNNSLAKAVAADSYVDAPSTAADATVRIGDTATYRLVLNLGEGTTNNVQVTDVLPTAMAFDSLVSITPASGSGSFNYSVAGQPAPGDTGTLVWNLGNITNTPSNDKTPVDALTIEYTARVLNNTLAQQPATTLTNTATLSYTDGSGTPVVDPTRLVASADLTVWQPNLTVSKRAVPDNGDPVIDAGEGITYIIDVVNSGTAPAYDTVVQDILPVGLRQGGVTTTSITRLPAATALPVFNPVYDPATGTATWNFDSIAADTYTIPADETLRIVYQVQADADLGPGLALTNAATATLYYSFDDEAIPGGGTADQREEYGPSNTAAATPITTPQPVALLKQTTQATASIGEQFKYRLTVPATAQTTALNDVRIIDDLTTSAADLSFVSVTKISGSLPWTPVNTGDAKHLVIEDTANGIDIPANEQVVIEITVVVDDSSANVIGPTFSNIADYTFNRINNDNSTQAPGLPGTSSDMTIAGPDSVTLVKTGPGTMRTGLPGTFTIKVHNTGTAPAWDLTITDPLPDPTPGGMCDAAPANITAQIFQSDGTTPVSPVLTQGTDYVAGFSGSPGCTLTITMQSAAAAIGADQYLIVTYEASLDADSVGGTALTNVAAATEWFSGDTAGSGATGAIHTYTGTLSDGTVGTLDEQDACTLTTELPVLVFRKSVVNVTSGQNPGTNAQPGDTLRYTLQVENISPIDLSNLALVDELDNLNASAMFMPGSLSIVSVPPGADTGNTDPNGGAKGTGLLDVRNMTLDAQGGFNDAVDIIFEVRLAPVINSGTVVLNQAHLTSFGVELAQSDDPNVNGVDDPNVAGDEDPTATVITSAPVFEIWKTSQDLTGDPNVLLAGETLRYTITIKNIGNEDAVSVRLRDLTPANTTYAANSTTLNGNAVPDPSPGVNPLTAGIPINAPENLTSGYMRADAAPGASNLATVTFNVVVDPSAMSGLVIENQGFVSSAGAGSGTQPDRPSDDPGTPVPDDPTRDVVGNVPLLYAHKTVTISQDNGIPGIVDADDVLLYTITISNTSAIPATGVVLTDSVPTYTTYYANSMQLNGTDLPDDGDISPLIAGLTIQSGDNPGPGIVSADQNAVVTFEVTVNSGVLPGTVIRNQGTLTCTEVPPQLTDADGLPGNGFQPTVVMVGDVQLVTVTKSVAVVGGGGALAGGQLEYTVRVTNVGSVPATNVVVTDDLGLSLDTLVTYVTGSGTLNGAAAGVTFAGSLLTADYGATYGELPAGASAELRFRVQIKDTVAIETTITNKAEVSWDGPEPASASVSIDVGGTPGTAALNGNVWHDANLDKFPDSTETHLAGWSVALYRNNQLVTTVSTDANGAYRISGLVPNAGTADLYELRFRAPGAGPNTASLGNGDSPFTNGPQRISAITVASGSNLQNLYLPLWPNGTVYNSVVREPVAGASLALLNAATGEALPDGCFDDPVQQNQVTAQDGFYKFDLNFSDPSCPAGGAYLIEVTPPATSYMPGPSLVIPPASDASTLPFSVSACPGSTADAVAATVDYCEAVTTATVPPLSVPPRSAGTIYYLHLLLSDGTMPDQGQIFNNPIPIDPVLDGAVAITKASSMLNVTRAALVPYTITVTNVLGVPLYDIGIVDRLPAGFKYVAGSARLEGNPVEPRINGRELLWDNLELQVNQKYTLKLLLVVGSGVSEGEYVNRAQVVNTALGSSVSGEASATVRVIPDPDFDCTDVTGKVFDDRNLNGHQDGGEDGLAGVRVVTARGLIAATDEYGRFHYTCAAVPDEDRGSNFILKLDERSLPSGYRLTTENPRVLRATRGKMIRFNFGATIHRVVRIDIADGVFEPGSSELRLQWAPRITQLMEELKKAPSVLRISYLGDVEREGLVHERLRWLKKEIINQWNQSGGDYRLTVETEVFWRRGSPQGGHR